METVFTSATGCIMCICASCKNGYSGDRTCPHGVCGGIPNQQGCHYMTDYCNAITGKSDFGKSPIQYNTHTNNNDPWENADYIIRSDSSGNTFLKK